MTLPERILNNLFQGYGQFKIETADLCQGDCHGAIMDTKIGTNRVVISIRFAGGAYPAHRTVSCEKTYGVMVSHVIGAISRFRSELEVDGWNEGVYEVLISRTDPMDEVADWTVVYGPYQGPGSWNGRY